MSVNPEELVKSISPIKKTEGDTRLGWKIVSWDGERLRSLADPFLIYNIKEGDVVSNPRGFYLGTTRRFVEDHYTGLTDYPDALICFLYNKDVVISGYPWEEGEVKVLEAEVYSIEYLD